ncbi:MAG TPA: hypothetical protein DEP53_12715, partial [Bacteroidetes bacterium]|nr:hypothetical protein [Bacteroidota bacterium]
ITRQHTPQTIDSLISELKKLNGTATKQELIEFFRKHVPTYSPSENPAASSDDAVTSKAAKSKIVR